MNQYNKQYRNSGKSQLDVRSILQDVGAAWWMILLVALSASMLTYSAVSFTHKPTYSVKTTFTVSGRGADANAATNLSATNEMAQKFSAILENNILKKKVSEELGWSVFDAQMRANIVPESNLIELSVTAESSQKAFLILKSVLKNYKSVSDYVVPNIVLDTLEQPEVSGVSGNQPPIRKYMIMMFVLSAGAVTLMLAVASYMRDTVKNEYEFLQKVDGALLGSVNHANKKNKDMSMLISNPLLSFQYVESYRMLASRVKGRMDKKKAKILMVTSVAENEGKSTVASNLALVLAQEQNNVLLIDCDFRKPALYKIFEHKSKARKDFVDVIRGKENVDNLFVRYKETSLCIAFSFRPSGNFVEVISNGKLKSVLDIARESMDYIILDTPPMGMVADAEELAALSDAALLVVRQDKVLSRDINDAIDVLNQHDEKLIGCVFGDVRSPIGRSSLNEGHYGNYSKADR